MRVLMAALFLIMPAVANAQQVYEQSVRPTFGCYSEKDALNLLQQGMKLGLMPQVARAEIGAKDCFDISVDEVAVFDPDIKSNDMFYFLRGIVPLHTASGREFYSIKWIWQYAGDVTSMMQ